MRLTLFGLVGWCFSLSLVAYGAPPDWFHRRAYREYTPEFGIVGVGSGATLQQAIDAATADIARQIEVEVEGEMESAVQSLTVEDREAISARYYSNIRTTTQASLTGVQTVITAQDDANFYALCYLDRDQFTQGLRDRLAQLDEEVDRLFQDASNFFAQGNFKAGWGQLEKAIDRAAEGDALYFLYRQFSPYPYSGSRSAKALDLTQAKVRVQASLRLEKVAGDNQEAVRGKTLPQPLVAKALYADLGGTLHPLHQALVICEHERGEIAGKGFTDTEGLIYLPVRAVGRDEQVYRAKLIQIDDINLHSHPSVEFRYRSLPPPAQSFLVKVVDEEGRTVVEMEEKVKRGLTALGHRVVDSGGEFKVMGVVSVAERRELPGYSGTRYMVKVNLDLKVIEVKGEKIVTQSLFISSGTSDKGPQPAFAQALQTLTLDEESLSQMLSVMER